MSSTEITERHEYFVECVDNLLAELLFGNSEMGMGMEEGVASFVEYFIDYFRRILQISEDPNYPLDSILDSFIPLHPEIDECATQISSEYEEYR